MSELRNKFFKELTRKRDDGIVDFNCMPHIVFDWMQKELDEYRKSAYTEYNSLFQKYDKLQKENDDASILIATQDGVLEAQQEQIEELQNDMWQMFSEMHKAITEEERHQSFRKWNEYFKQ